MKHIPTWRESIDTPENRLSPNHIHASVEEMQDAMQAEIDALRQRMQELEAAQTNRITWGIDWGKHGDRTAVSIVKKHADGSAEIVATEYEPNHSTSKTLDIVEGHPV